VFSNFFIKILEFYIVSSLELYRYDSASGKRFLAFLTHNLHYFQKLYLHKKIAKVIKTLAIQSTVNTFPEAL
ncbi:hypothetical protein, partial [Holdemanella sp.]|uniref:hypothetical protein n=1 Tax=Holdemanella sp. TaxID=1971762 RepID=UPI002583E6FD